jgi:hypothetical protein
MPIWPMHRANPSFASGGLAEFLTKDEENSFTQAALAECPHSQVQVMFLGSLSGGNM